MKGVHSLNFGRGLHEMIRRTASLLNATCSNQLCFSDTQTPPAPCLFPSKVTSFFLFSDRTLVSRDAGFTAPPSLIFLIACFRWGCFLQSLRGAGFCNPLKTPSKVFAACLLRSSLAASSFQSFIVPRTGSSYRICQPRFPDTSTAPIPCHPLPSNPSHPLAIFTHLFVLSLYSTRYPHSLQRIGSPFFSVTLLSQSPHR